MGLSDFFKKLFGMTDKDKPEAPEAKPATLAGEELSNGELDQVAGGVRENDDDERDKPEIILPPRP